MTFQLDLKAIGLGVLSIFGGYLALGVLAAIFVKPVGPVSAGLGYLVMAVAILPTALAGFIGAYFARANRVVHGLIAGGIGALLVFFSTVLASPFGGTMGLLLALLVVWLGAIFGSHARNRRGP